MREKTYKSWKRITAAVLIAVIFATSVSLESIAVESKEAEQKTEETVKRDKKNSEKKYSINKKNVIPTENTETSTTYDVGNGVKVTELYGQDVRFKDKKNKNKLTDYDASLIEVDREKSEKGQNLEKYAYENKTGDKKQYFPEEVTEETPVLMEYKDYQIRFRPEETTEEQITEDEIQPVEVENEKVIDVYEEERTVPLKAVYASEDKKRSYEYTSLDI